MSDTTEPATAIRQRQRELKTESIRIIRIADRFVRDSEWFLWHRQVDQLIDDAKAAGVRL